MMRMMQGRVSISDNLESLGALSPIFIDSIIREKNLEYLEHLCTYCENMTLNYLWFTKQSGENKKKLLIIYQLAISYSKRLEKTYRQHQNQLAYNLQRKREEVRNKRKQVKQHKMHVTSLKDKMKFMKLNKVKNTHQQYLHKMKELQHMYEQQKLKNRTASNFYDPRTFQPMQMHPIYSTHNPYQNISPSGQKQYRYPAQARPGNFGQSVPGAIEEAIIRNIQQYSPQRGHKNEELNIGRELNYKNNDNRHLENRNILDMDQINRTQNSKKQSQKIIAKDSSKNSKKSSKSSSPSILSNECIEDALRQSMTLKRKNSSQIYLNDIESLNNLHLLPNSNKSEKPDSLKKIQDAKENPNGNLDLFYSNMGSPKNTQSKHHFGGCFKQNTGKKIQSKESQGVPQCSKDVDLRNSNQKNVFGKTSQEQYYNVYESNIQKNGSRTPQQPSHNNNQTNAFGKTSQEQFYNIHEDNIQKNEFRTPQQPSHNYNHKNAFGKTSQEQFYNIHEDNIQKNGSKMPLHRPPSINKKSLEELDDERIGENFVAMSQKNLNIGIIPPKNEHKDQKEEQTNQEHYQDDFDEFGDIPEQSHIDKKEQPKSTYVGIPKKELIPLMKPEAHNVSQLSMIGSLRQHSFVKRTNPNFKKSNQDISESDMNDFLNYLIQIPEQSKIARPSSKINIKPKSKLPPPYEKKTSTSQSLSSHGGFTKDQGKQSSSNLDNPNKYHTELSVPLGDSFELPEGSYIKSKDGGNSNIEMLVIPGSIIQEKGSQRGKDLSRKVNVPLVDSTLIDEAKTRQSHTKADKFSSILTVPVSYPKQDQKSQSNISDVNVDIPNDDDELIAQKLDVNDSLMAQHQKQDIQLKLFSMLKMNASSIPKNKINKYDSKWIEKELFQTLKKTPSQIQDWVPVQELYQRQFNAMQAKLAKKREQNDKAVISAPKRTIDKQEKISRNDDDLTYSQSIIDPQSRNLERLPKKNSNHEKYFVSTSDIQAAKEEDMLFQRNKKAKHSTLKDKARKIPKELKETQQNGKLSTLDERSSSSTYEVSISGPEDIIGKIQQGHRYDVQNPLDNIIRNNKTLFKKEIKRKYEEDESDW